MVFSRSAAAICAWRSARVKVARLSSVIVSGVGRHLPGLGQPHCIIAGCDSLAERRGARQACRRRHHRRLGQHRPAHPVEPAPLRGRHLVDDIAGGVENLELHAPDHVPGFLVVSDGRAARRIVAGVAGVALGPAAVALDALLDRRAGEKRGCARQRRGGQLSQRADVVDHPDAAAVSRQHQIVLALLQRDVAHGEAVGEIVRLELRPRLTAVDRHEQAELGSQVEDVGVDPVLLDDVRIAANAAVPGPTSRRHVRP